MDVSRRDFSKGVAAALAFAFWPNAKPVNPFVFPREPEPDRLLWISLWRGDKEASYEGYTRILTVRSRAYWVMAQDPYHMDRYAVYNDVALSFPQCIRLCQTIDGVGAHLDTNKPPVIRGPLTAPLMIFPGVTAAFSRLALHFNQESLDLLQLPPEIQRELT